ncbi:MAG: GxxExxY protein [Chloroflexi bacterium]|nr:GxxExxY protein [Chloroflexota bacterium]
MQLYPHQKLTEWIIGAAIEVHKHLGPGLLESIYQTCLAHEMSLRGLRFAKEKPLPVEYKGIRLESGYRLDFIVDDKVVVELKAVDSLHDVHKAQLLTYLKLTGCKVGLLLNFNSAVLKDGIERLAL